MFFIVSHRVALGQCRCRILLLISSLDHIWHDARPTIPRGLVPDKDYVPSGEGPSRRAGGWGEAHPPEVMPKGGAQERGGRARAVLRLAGHHLLSRCIVQQNNMQQ